MTPLVSVTMPCYNARATLPMALASLLAQGYENWECIVVDDGSTDNPQEVVEAAADPRFRLVRFEENRGRGAARQAALDAARGKYLAMLDADDWYYPDKLARQVETMESTPELALVSSGMAILDSTGGLAGIRCRGTSAEALGPVRSLAMPPVAHAPSLISMDVARRYRYDSAFLVAQDVDFLIAVMLDRKYCVLPAVSYAYTEHASASRDKILAAHRFLRRSFAKHTMRFPIASRVNTFKSMLKSLIYRAGFALGQEHRLIARRSRKPTADEMSQYKAAKQRVESLLRARFDAASCGESAQG